MINISSLIKLDEYTNIIPLPRLQLMTRSFEIIGNISHYSDWRVSIRGNELDEISFTVTKYVNGVLNPIWDDIVDLKIVSLERGGKFEIQVTYTDESKTTKSVSGVSLETELGQVALYEFHVNDDDYDAMEMEKHGEIVPTVLYDPTRPDYSLIHRVLKDKTPHWTINDAKMPEYILVAEDREPEAVNTFQRQFTVDGTSIYDFLTGDVAKEANIVFRFDTDQRKLWFEPLLDYYDEHDQHIVDAIGEDTTILVSKRKLGNEITINSNKDSVKNCFRVEGGDDLINSQIAVLNMTGDNYIYHFADFQLADMPEDLREAVIHYSSWLDTYRDEYYGTVEEQGADGLYTQFTKANAQLYYLGHEMAPAVSPEPEVATPQAMWEKIKAIMDISQGHQIVGVADLNYITSSAFVGATNNVETMAQIDASDSRYKVEVVKDTTSYTDATRTWSGVIRVTRVSDTTQFYPPIVDNPSLYDQYKFNIEVREDTDTDLWYTRQKVEIALHKGEMSRVDAEFNDQTTPEEMERYFRQWNLTKLKSFSDGYDSCISTIMSGKSYQEREIAQALYDIYKERLDAVTEVLNERQAQVDEQQAIVDRLAGYTDDNGEYQKGELQKFQESKSFIYYLTNDTPDHERGIPVYTQAEADEMFKIYRSYIREDQYQNSNFVSDTYETDQNELIKVAKELLTDAEKEIKKSCVLQRTMTVNVNNLLALPEFKPLYDKFDLFNYIRVRTDDEILKLRLIGIDYSGDSMQSVEVTFSDQIETVDGNVSDLQSVLDQAKSIATSYNAVTLQASKGAEAQGYVTNIVQNGLDAANTMLKNSNDNEVTISRAGIIAKRMDNEGEYGQKQLRIIGNGMYMTEDAWDSVAMAVGEITVPSLNNGDPMYGVIADAIVGRFIAGNSLYIGNEEGSVAIDGDGITITNGTITWGDDNVNAPEISDIPDLSTTIQTINEEIEQLDGRIQTYCQPTDPSVDWTTTEEKDKHIGDIWYDTTNEITKTYSKNGNVYSWEEVHDATLEAIASQRATIFTAIPDQQLADGYCYKVNDLWYLNIAGDGENDYPVYPANTVLVATQSATVYSKTHWVKKDRYTDDDYVINFINTTYATDKQNLQSQIDGKVDTFYQSTKPHQEYTGIQDNTEYNKWIGDLWYDTVNNKSFMYRKEEVTPSTTPATYNYKWEEADGVPQSVYDEIDGKNTIYTSKPETPQDDGYYYRQGDVWIINPTPPDTTITVNNVAYEANTILYASQDRSDRFHDEDWSPTTTKSAEDALDQIGTLNSDYSAFKTQVNNSLNTTVVGQDYIISPKIGGGYLYLVAKDDPENPNSITASVEINPSGSTIKDGDGDTTSGYIIKAMGTVNNTLTRLFSIDTSGNAYFSGEIQSSAGRVGGWLITSDALSHRITIQDRPFYTIYDVSLGVNVDEPIILTKNNGSTLGTYVKKDITKVTINHNGILFNNGYKYERQGYYSFDCDAVASITSDLSQDIENKTSSDVISYRTDLTKTGIPSTQKTYYTVTGHKFYANDNLVFDIERQQYDGPEGEDILPDVTSAKFYTTWEVECDAGFKYVHELYSPSNNPLYSVYIMDSIDPENENAALMPAWDGRMDLGSEDYGMWNTLYAWSGPVHPSDRRVKNTINSIIDSYENLFKNLKPVSYKYNRDEGTHIGFIAQDVEDALKNSNIPEIEFSGLYKKLKYDTKVDTKTHTKTKKQIFDENGNPDYNYSLCYEEFIALNTHMIQKLYKRVEELEAEVASLKSK